MLSNNSFWSEIPAAAYVLFGVFISAVFTLLGVIISGEIDNKNNKELKELENKHSKKLKELENKHSKEAQRIEIQHKEKLQGLEEGADRKKRLFDNKMEMFTRFYKCYAGILKGGLYADIIERCLNLRDVVFELRLLIPSKERDLTKLDEELVAYTNLFEDIISGKEEDTEVNLKNKKTPILNKLAKHANAIRDFLPEEL